VDLAAVLGGHAGEVEDFDLDAFAFERRAGDIGQAPALRHLPRAGVLAARRGIDNQRACRPGRLVARLGGADRIPGGDPVDRQVIFGISVARAGLPGDGALSLVGIRLPGDRGEPLDLRG
jgi:hypothetical protein